MCSISCSKGFVALNSTLVYSLFWNGKEWFVFQNVGHFFFIVIGYSRQDLFDGFMEEYISPNQFFLDSSQSFVFGTHSLHSAPTVRIVQYLRGAGDPNATIG